MGKAPGKCPMCGEEFAWRRVELTRRRFSLDKAALACAIAGLLVLLVGTFGSAVESYCCGNCGFIHKYSG